MKLQQYSGPVMAKGLEDTAFYRYNRFIALNEVGGNPDQFGLSLAAFHKANGQRCERWPHAMLATSTHDTKRGEDTRARLAVLSEMPEEWAKQVEIWSRILRAGRGDVEGTAPPDRNDEYMFYQMLSAPGRSSCSAPLARCGGPRRLCRAHQGGAQKVAARSQGALHLGGARPGLRGGDAGLRRACPRPGRARPRFSEPSCPSPSASPGLARRTAWLRPC